MVLKPELPSAQVSLFKHKSLGPTRVVLLHLVWVGSCALFRWKFSRENYLRRDDAIEKCRIRKMRMIQQRTGSRNLQEAARFMRVVPAPRSLTESPRDSQQSLELTAAPA